MIERIIDNWLKSRGITNYKLTQATWNLSDWSTAVSLAHNCVAFVYELCVIGKIADYSNIGKSLLRLDSTAARIDYSEIFKFTQLAGGFEQIESNFISRHETKMQITIATGDLQMFTEMKKGYISYYVIEFD